MNRKCCKLKLGRQYCKYIKSIKNLEHIITDNHIHVNNMRWKKKHKLIKLIEIRINSTMCITLSKSARFAISSHRLRITCWYSANLPGLQSPLPSMMQARNAMHSKSFESKNPLLSMSAGQINKQTHSEREWVNFSTDYWTILHYMCVTLNVSIANRSICCQMD